MEPTQNLNDTATFTDPLNGLNMSMTDNIFTESNINEKYHICPLCECKIIDSSVLNHFWDFHKIGFYNEILKKIKQKKEIIQKSLGDIRELRFIFETCAIKSVRKPSNKIKSDYKNLVMDII